jgi:hypothetical protein
VSRFLSVLLPAVAVLAAGCQASPEAQPPVPSQDTSDATVTEEPAYIPEFVPGGSALENKPYIDYLVELKVNETGASPKVREVVELLIAEGFTAADIEFTPDTSLISLPADSVTVAIRIDEECIIAQWGSDWYASSVEPVLVTGTCLLGTTESLD